MLFKLKIKMFFLFLHADKLLVNIRVPKIRYSIGEIFRISKVCLKFHAKIFAAIDGMGRFKSKQVSFSLVV